MIESSFLLQAGVEKLLLEVPGLILEDVFDGSEKKLADKILALKPQIIFINAQTVSENLFALVNSITSTESILIGLVAMDTPLNVKSMFRHHLTITDGKYELLEKLKSIIGELPASKTRDNESSVLSEREKTILKQVVSGSTAQDIADKLFLSVHTVNTHRKNITNKLGIKTVSGLTVYALINKIVNLNEIDSK